MNDFFKLLGQPREPWLDADTIRQAFVTAAAELHPDRLHDAPAEARRQAHDRYTALNQAQLCLQSARTRLRHLLELEQTRPVQDLQEIPEPLMEVFTQLSRQLRDADAYLRKLVQVESPLLRVALFEQGEELRQSLQQAQSALRLRRQELEDRLRALNTEWQRLSREDPAARHSLLPELEALYRLISFNDRWEEQVASRMAHLVEAL